MYHGLQEPSDPHSIDCEEPLCPSKMSSSNYESRFWNLSSNLGWCLGHSEVLSIGETFSSGSEPIFLNVRLKDVHILLFENYWCSTQVHWRTYGGLLHLVARNEHMEADSQTWIEKPIKRSDRALWVPPSGFAQKQRLKVRSLWKVIQKNGYHIFYAVWYKWQKWCQKLVMRAVFEGSIDTMGVITTRGWSTPNKSCPINIYKATTQHTCLFVILFNSLREYKPCSTEVIQM